MHDLIYRFIVGGAVVSFFAILGDVLKPKSFAGLFGAAPSVALASLYAVRFLFGGAITAITGLIAKHYGPVFGGLFLAFPAIFPASATLIETHEKRKKLQAGISGTMRGRYAATLDARGAALGTIGLSLFALIVWKLLPHWNTAATLLVALGVWVILSVLVWYLFKSRGKSGHRSHR